MATILERFKETSAQSFNHQSGTTSATGNSSIKANLPIIKDETSQRSTCPYTNEGKQNGALSNKNWLEEEKSKDSPTRSLSPEFLLGSSEKTEQQAKSVEGSTEVVNPVACVFCNEVVPNQTALEEHKLSKHHELDKKWYDCSVCEKHFTHRSSRDIHLRVHTGQRPYECDYCKKRFRVSSHLRDHVRTHTGERPFKCEVCGRGFKQSSDMKKHRKTHFKEMPRTPLTNNEASYMIVRPEENTTSIDHNSNDLRSPTERQNLKLVIKRERKTTDRSPMDNTTTTVSSDNTLPSGDCTNSAKTVSGNNTPPGEKLYEVSTQNMKANERTLPASDLDTNANWATSSYYSHSVPTIKYTEKLAKSSPGKVPIKRKLDKGSKSYERNGFKATTYPSMASGFGQIYSSNVGVSFDQEESGLILSHNTDQKDTAQSYGSDNKTGYPQAEFEKRLSYDNQNTFQMSNQNEEHGGNDEFFWQPQDKIIKSEKLSPNSHEQSTLCRGLSTANHEFPTVNHEQPMGIRDKLTDIHDQRTNIHEQAVYNHENPPYEHQEPTGIHEQATATHDPTPYSDWQMESSEDHTMNVVNEHMNNSEAAATTNEELMNNHVNSNPDMTSVDSIAEQRADDVTYTETQSMKNTSTEIPENNMDAVQWNSEVAPSNMTTVRKTMVVKIRPDKTGAVKTIRTPIKLKDNEENVKCSVCEQSFKNMEEFTAHKCGKNGKSFKCTICNKTFARQTLLRQHMVLHQGSKRFRFKCNYCGRAFRHRSHLRDHERIHTGERPFKCSFCPKAFKQSSDHRKHENLHTGTTRYRCEKCSLDFKRCDALKRHAMMHTKGEVTLLKCEKCRSLFATADGHMSHVCLSRPYRYRCQICPERFTDPDDLRQHCYNLHGEQSTLSCLKCEFCKLEFDTLEKLDEHLGTHLLKKTHRCRTCDQRFSLLNQLVEHVKIHSTPSLGSISAFDQSEENSVEEARTIKKNVNQHKESPPNVTVMPHASNRPIRQRYDFIPSKYQPPVHTNPMYGEIVVGNWARQHNYYLQLRPEDHGVPRQDKPAPISPRHQPISPRHQPISPQHNPITPRSISTTDPISSRSDMKPYRRSTEPPENHPTSSRDTTEPYRHSTELSENHPISSRRNTEHHRPNTKSSDVKPMSSESGSNESQPPTIANAVADPFSTTSFAAYHAIALSRSTHRTSHGLRREQKPSQCQSPSSRYEQKTGRHEQTTSRHDPTSSRHDLTTSVANVEVSHRPDVTTEAGKVCLVNNLADSPMVDRLDVLNNSDSLETHRNAEESRRYSNDVRLQTEVIRKSSDQTRTNLEETRRNSDEVRISSERIRSSSESNQIGSQNIQIDLTRSRDNLTTSMEGDTADGGLSDESSSHRKNNESHLAQSQPVVKRKYTCLNCRSEFYHESSLVDHVCDIFSETLYSCLVCKEDFEKYEDLQKHMRAHWKHVVYFKCTLCRERLRSEELLKKHNLKHLEDARTESVDSEDKDGYHWIENDKIQDDRPETLITPPDSAKSVTSPVICSVSNNIVTKPAPSKRGYNERRKSNMDADVSPNIELTHSSHDDVILRSNPGSYIPYYEARKQAPGYFNVLSQGQAMVVSAMHAAMETSGRYHVPNGLLYSPAMSRSAYTIEHTDHR